MCVLEREWEFGLQLYKLCSGSKGLKLYDDFVIAICEYMCMQMFVDVWHYICTNSGLKSQCFEH